MNLQINKIVTLYVINMIFLDNNSTTQIDPRVLKEIIPYFNQKYGNPSSNSHKFGWEANDAIDISRKKISNFINSEPNEIIFTSGATESNNLAILGYFNKNNFNNCNIITSNIEHRAILDVCHIIKKKYKNSVRLVLCNDEGLINKTSIEKMIDSNTVLISIMHANNEIGTIQPIKQIGALCKKNNIIFHVDAAQSLGKIKIDVKEMNIDLLSISSHKIYGPKGIGALYINKQIKNSLNPILVGGGQESGMRAGTLPTPLIVGFGKAAEISNIEMEKETKNILKMRKIITDGILNSFKNSLVNGSLDNRIAGNINFTFPFLNGMSIINSVSDIAISNGSACSSSSSKPSHVLTALGRNKKEAISSCRIGIGRFNNINEINIALDSIIKTLKVKS